MTRLIFRAVQWILRKLGLLIVIVAILVSPRCCNRNGGSIARPRRPSGQQATERIAAFHRELDAIDANIEAFETQAQASRGQYLDLAKQARAARRAAHRARARSKFSSETSGRGTTMSVPQRSWS